MSSTKVWKPKIRDYEIESVKYQILYNPTNENPLVKLEYVRKERSSTSSIISTVTNKKKKKKVFDPLSGLSSISKSSSTSTSTKTKSSNSTSIIASSLTSTVNVKDPSKVKENLNTNNSDQLIPLSNKSYSLIIKDNNSETLVPKSLEESWLSLKDNLLTIFCSNSSLIVKSLVSVSMNDNDEDLQKNYKIDKGRTRLEELENSKDKGDYNITTSGEYVKKLEVLKREMFIVSFFQQNFYFKFLLFYFK